MASTISCSSQMGPDPSWLQFACGRAKVKQYPHIMHTTNGKKGWVEFKGDKCVTTCIPPLCLLIDSMWPISPVWQPVSFTNPDAICPIKPRAGPCMR